MGEDETNLGDEPLRREAPESACEAAVRFKRLAQLSKKVSSASSSTEMSPSSPLLSIAEAPKSLGTSSDCYQGLYMSFIRMARETAFPTATLNRFLCLSESNRTRLSLPLSKRSCLFSSLLTLFSLSVRLSILNARPTSPAFTSNERAVVVVTGAE